MTDVLIRNVPDDALAGIDEQAARLGLSRGEYLRRQITQLGARHGGAVSREQVERFAELAADLLDEDVMRDAWS